MVNFSKIGQGTAFSCCLSVPHNLGYYTTLYVPAGGPFPAAVDAFSKSTIGV